ncbi:acetyl-CoA synthetase-like protein [Auriculariales sp. MPI-PUGE-AT-0066]|nr:acetyl-CoA synthetase-like protein [Auriculariales sp. MPI-PUGE-AT-0066]
MSQRQATYTSPVGLRVQACNTTAFLFSNPFLEGSLAVTSAPNPEQRDHSLKSRIPPHKPLFIDAQTGAQVSWQRTNDDALRVARGLRALRFLQPPAFTPGSKIVQSPIVMVHLPNCVAYGPILFGVWAAGLTASTVNPLLTRAELLHVLNVSKPAAIITVAGQGLETLKSAVDALEDHNLQQHYRSGKGIFVVDPSADYYGAATSQSQRPHYALDAHEWTVLLRPVAAQSAEWVIPPMSEEECKSRVALVMWSSGTSGKSKGVALSHYSIIWQQIALWHAMVELGPDERLLALAPVYHSFGISVTLMTAPMIGASCLMIPKFDLEGFLKLASSFRATYLHIAPPIALALAKSPLVDKYDLRSVNRAVSGGAPLGQDIIQQVFDRTGIRVTLGFGMTETCGGTAQQGMMTWEEMKAAPGSTGRFMLGFEVRLVDEDEKVVQRGAPGEIYVRSPMNFLCYLNNPEATRDALSSDGWYRTGDVGILDEKDNIYIVDRLKDVIKYKGLQVAPAELEAVLCACPLVKDAGVISVYSDSEATELPRAYVVPADPALIAAGASDAQHRQFATEVKKYVEGHVAKYKYLRGGIIIVPIIPTSPSGKRLRKSLKSLKGTLIELYGPTPKL